MHRPPAPPDAAAIAAELAVELGLIQFAALEKFMTAEMTRLLASVTNIRGKAQSLVALNAGLSAFMREHAGDAEAMNGMADDLDAEGVAIQASLDANPLPAPPTE